MGDEPTKKGTAIHFVRPQETGCRPGTLLGDSFEETVRAPTVGTFEFGHFTYGDPPSSDSRHTFEAVRARDPIGRVDTWHLASECPFTAQPRRQTQTP